MKVIWTSRIACSEAQKLADAYLDGELPITAKRRVLEHKRSCEDCHERINAIAHLKYRVRHAVRRVEIPAHFRRELRAAIGS